ncbi:MAG TPA: transporter [Vicinamibacterales bacterium]|nr:transporter [Vicinamibacterales bacterium]
MRTSALLTALMLLCLPLHAQTIDDGIMMASRSLQAGTIYTHDSWNQYWEGTLKRANGNIGTVTTQTSTWSAAFGLGDRITLFASVPHVWTRPSAGVLKGQRGFQDLMLGGKYAVVEHSPAGRGLIRAMVALSGTLPVTDYTPDFAPMSIGSQSRRLSGRLTVNYQSGAGVYVNASTAYTRRSEVTLDRPYYYTDGQLFFTDEVEMPDVVDYTISAGYLKHDLNTNVSWSVQETEGGGDIRRQDMPFVSNRVNFSKLGAMAMYPVPRLRVLSFYLSVAHTVDGRNVGQSTTYAAGLLYSRASRGRLIR